MYDSSMVPPPVPPPDYYMMQGAKQKNFQPMRARQRPQNDFMSNLTKIGVPLVNKSLLNDSIAGSTIEVPPGGGRDVNRSFALPT